MANRACEVCGAEFYASPGHVVQGWGRFCSKQCLGQAFRGSGNPRYDHSVADRVCRTCGKRFRKKPSAVKRGEGIYCSRFCQVADKRQAKTCRHCGKDFFVYNCWAQRGGGIYCSRQCYGADKRSQKSRVCLVCGKSFLIKPSGLAGRHAKAGAGSYCSMRCKAKAMSRSQLTASGKNRSSHGGKRDDLGIYVRSGWEANYCRYLKWRLGRGEIRSWEYEPDTFEFPVKRGSRFYTPDFKIIDVDGAVVYHEIKGWMDQKSRTKIKRMGIHYPDVALVVIDSNAYKALARDVKNLVPNWE